MKQFNGTIAVILLLSAITLSQAQKPKSRDDDSNELSGKRVKEPAGMRGSCSCRDMQAQIDLLEGRLDRMIDLWNDFVDKNRRPYDERDRDQGGVRRPPGNGGGRPPYWDEYNRQQEPGRPPVDRSGRYMDRERGGGGRGRDMGYEDNPRRFRF